MVTQQAAYRPTPRRFTQQTVRRRHLDVPRVTDVTQQHDGDGAMHDVVPVNAVVGAVARLTTERVVQVHDVEVVI